MAERDGKAAVWQDEIPDEVLEKENYRASHNFRWLGSSMKATEELCLTVCGVERCVPDKSFGPTVRRDWHVHFVLHGKGVLETGGRTWTVTRGQIFATLPGEEVFYRADASDPWYYTWVSFSGTRAAYYMERAGITPDHPVRECGVEPEQFLTFTEKILEHHQLTVANELIRTSVLYEIMALLVQTAHVPRGQSGSCDYSQDTYINAALEYIHHNPGQVQVSELAEMIGISRFYLTRIFQEKLHLSPKEYIFNFRLSEASRLLRSTNRTVQEIAGQMGYASPFSFSQSFKKVYGVSPARYREQIRRSQVESVPEENEACEGEESSPSHSE